MTLPLRPYQSAAVDALWAYLASKDNNPLIVCPTGSGKSLILGEVCRRACAEASDARIVVATHRKELIEQDTSAIRRIWPDAPVGIWSAGLHSRQVRQVTVCGIQSVHKRAKDFGAVDMLLIDEAHLLPFSGEGMYRRFIDELSTTSKHLRIIGLTATPFRLAGGMLTRGQGRIFSSVCYDLRVQQLINEGYLAPLTTPKTSTEYSTAGVRIDGGEFAPGALSDSVDEQYEVTRVALAESLTLLEGRRAVLCFCVGVKHAEATADILRAAGQTVQVITGDTDPLTRSSSIGAFRRGEVRWLVGVDVLTTGFDAPITDGIVLLRPTQSAGLYVQVLGRGMRIAEGKTDCLVLDYGGNIERHGPITDVRQKSAGEGKSVSMWKECPKCYAELALSKRECPECGYIFPEQPRPIDHDTKASRGDVMDAPEPVWIDVDSVRAYEWVKKDSDKPPTVCVEYNRNGRSVVREWVCPEHGGFAAQKFGAWWYRMGGDLPPPPTVVQAVERIDAGELREVEAVKVGKDGKFQRVLEVRFKVEQAAEGSVYEDSLPF